MKQVVLRSSMNRQEDTTERIARLLLTSQKEQQDSTHQHQETLQRLQIAHLERMQTQNHDHQKATQRAMLDSAHQTLNFIMQHQNVHYQQQQLQQQCFPDWHTHQYALQFSDPRHYGGIQMHYNRALQMQNYDNQALRSMLAVQRVMTVRMTTISHHILTALASHDSMT